MATERQRAEVGRTKTIGLCMIVKNEVPVLERCLHSVLPLIDYVLISDTGSSDGTQELIRKFLRDTGLPGEVIDRPWVDFAHNRTEALQALRKVDWIDYAFMIDADESMVFEEGFSITEFKSNLNHDVYDIQTRSGASRYLRAQMCSNRLPFRFRSVLHEFLEAPEGATRAIATGLYDNRQSGGARSRDPTTYAKDAKILRSALEKEDDPFLRSRYTFYLAQSYRDAGQPEEALSEYLNRANLGFWVEEIYVSLLQAALLMEQLKRPTADTVEVLLRAQNTLATRAEAMHAAARLCRKADLFESAYYYAKAGLAVGPASADALFVDSSVYEYGLLDELHVSAYWTGRFTEALEVGERLVREAKFPESERERMLANVAFARDKTRQ